ncbi:uncharacterized protein BKA78DRAFT_321178 [Phyllosticta capitalensis]|uniref:uncharacterized protein n=1 Tax=Phyllosticta capitalensis TaxID=121624 RepID=UPI003131F278
MTLPITESTQPPDSLIEQKLSREACPASNKLDSQQPQFTDLDHLHGLFKSWTSKL